MLSSLKAEVIKMRRLRLPLLAAGTGVLLVGLIWMILHGALVRLSHESNAEAPWQNAVIGDSTALIVLMLPTLVILITALSFFVEHRNNMWKQLRTTPASLTSVQAAKFILVQALIAFALIVALVVAIAGWQLMPKSVITVHDAEVRRILSVVTLELYVSLIPVALIQFVLSVRLPNVLYPVGIGLGLTFGCLFLTGESTKLWFPYAYPGAVVMSHFAVPPDQSLEQQRTDTDYRPPAGAFGAPLRERRRIGVDASHRNRHGLGSIDAPGSLSWITNPAREANIDLKQVDKPLSTGALRNINVFVMAGLSQSAGDGALTTSERQAIVNWVRDGGSLLLLTDHPPYGRPTEALANDFGVHFTIDVVGDSAFKDSRSTSPTRLVFSQANELLREHAITKGVRRVMTYTGQGIWRAASGTRPILALSPSARTTSGAVIQVDSPAVAAQMIAFEFGRGRVIVSGETAVFTAQTAGGSAVGLGDPMADDALLAFNAMRWLLRQ